MVHRGPRPVNTFPAPASRFQLPMEHHSGEGANPVPGARHDPAFPQDSTSRYAAVSCGGIKDLRRPRVEAARRGASAGADGGSVSRGPRDSARRPADAPKARFGPFLFRQKHYAMLPVPD